MSTFTPSDASTVDDTAAEAADPTPQEPAGRSRGPQIDAKAAVAFVGILVAWLVTWEATVATGLVGQLAPAPLDVAIRFVELMGGAFEGGGSSAGLFWQLASSLRRVLVGFGLAAVVAIPLGFGIGASVTLSRAVDPYVQILKPVSPLAWLPIGLALMQNSEATATFVIFMSALWPVLLNTILGVRSVPRIYLDLARTLRAGRMRVVRRILLPAAIPNIVTGVRLSLGISWLVIVAAEMLLGGRGIGYFVWNQWNNLDVSAILVAILVIGLVGFALDRGVSRIETVLAYRV